MHDHLNQLNADQKGRNHTDWMTECRKSRSFLDTLIPIIMLLNPAFATIGYVRQRSMLL